MEFTNIYLGFEKIKKNIKDHIHFQGIKELEYDYNEKIMNERIFRFLKKVLLFGESRIKVSDLPTAQEYGFSESLLLVDYLGYTFLYVLYDDVCIWINYEEKGKEICKKGILRLWDYLPNLACTELYRCVWGESCYIVNTYEAFLKYNYKCKLSESLTKENNLPFYADVETVLQANFPDCFCHKNDGGLYCQKRMEEGEYTVGIRRENCTLCFKFLFIDNMIIVTDCVCFYEAKLITGNINGV